MSFQNNLSIIFRGNSADGWFSAFLTAKFMKDRKPIAFFPIAANQPHTWPETKCLTNTEVLLLEVNVPEKIHERWIKAGAISVNWIDRYDSSFPQLSYVIDKCVSKHVYSFLFAGLSVPTWLEIIDRISRWSHVTFEDRCIREMIDPLVHAPTHGKIQEALVETEQFFAALENPVACEALLIQGRIKLLQKDAELDKVLATGTLHTFQYDHIEKWGLSSNWLGANVFLLDNTDTIIDTTEAAHLVFLRYTGLHVFINFRRKLVGGKESMIYSARSRNFNLLENGGILKGHTTSAGATIRVDDAMVVPFLDA